MLAENEGNLKWIVKISKKKSSFDCGLKTSYHDRRCSLSHQIPTCKFPLGKKAHQNPVVASSRSFYLNNVSKQCKGGCHWHCDPLSRCPSSNYLNLFPQMRQCSRLIACSCRAFQEFSSANERHLILGHAAFRRETISNDCLMWTTQKIFLSELIIISVFNLVH